MNQALSKIILRAEKRDMVELQDTFVDSGVAELINTVDHQVLYGRRGTGKTHAVSYLAAEASRRGDISLNIDLRTVGSPSGVLDPDSASLPHRASKLLVDLLRQVRDGLLNAVIESENLIQDEAFVQKLDYLAAAITSVQVVGDVERLSSSERQASGSQLASLDFALKPLPSVGATLASRSQQEERDLLQETRRGEERISLNFSDVFSALKDLSTTLTGRRIWLILDEWSSIPRDIQPYLAEFLNRCVLPLRPFTVKITAVEHQSTFRTRTSQSAFVGFELGADVAANLTLDDFMVYEKNKDRACAFFADLFFKHLTAGNGIGLQVEGLREPQDLVRIGFANNRAFNELIRAAEGVPRDAINMAARAAMQAYDGKISVRLVRDTARKWFQGDKFSALGIHPEANELFKWIIERVLRGEKARAFLVGECDARNPILLSLFDARVLHVIHRGYFAKSRPDERFDVWVIDYGAYVGSINTPNYPQGLLPVETRDGRRTYIDPNVPAQDHRSIRPAILDLGEFSAAKR